MKCLFSREIPPPRFYHSFTLLELLLVIGIVAILSITVMVVMNPAEQLKKARDTERKNELQTLNKVLGLFQLENSTASMGTTTWVYVSLPDASSTCGSWSLPTLLPGYSQYACKPESTYLKLDGTGWIPLNFQSLSSGNPMSNLPIDPKNNSSYYYSYVPTNPYYLAANLEATTTVLALGGGSSPLETYILNDEFTTARSAGAVNGTSAEPTGGTRTVTDTDSSLSITGGQLNFATNPASWNPLIWWPAVTRVAGRALVWEINITTPGEMMFGFDTDKVYAMGANGFQLSSGSVISLRENNTTLIDAGAFAASTSYKFTTVLRSTGTYYYIKGGAFTNWTLLWISSANSTSTLYPNIINYQRAVTVDNIRIPISTWLPTPLAYDTFTRADGAIGSSETTGPDSQTTPSLAWTGGAISTNKNVITPSLGSELWDADAAAFTSGTYAWTANGTNTITNDANSLKITYVDNANGATEYLRDSNDLSADLTNNTWYLLQFDAKVSASGSVNVYTSGSGNDNTGPAVTNTDFQTYYVALRKDAVSGNPYIMTQNMGAGESIWLDNISIKPITSSTMFSSVSTSDSDVIADVNITIPTPISNRQAGLVLNLDSTSSPSNFIVVYYSGGKVFVDEVVAGTYTNKQNTSVNYSAGATLRAIRQGTKLRVYYNNALVGAELTMTANTNTKHGLFSTYSGNSFDNFTLWARGTGNEYADMPQ